MVRCHHGFCIVLQDHHHRVAQVTQAKQGLEQATIIPLMETDRGLVENVEYADETRTDLRGELMANVAAAQSNVKIIQTNIDEKPEPFANFFQDAMGNH